jgi:hypothetical protein
MCSPWFRAPGPPECSALPFPGSSEASSPASTVLWRCPTPCAPLATLRCLRLAIPCGVPGFRSRRSRTPNRGPGVHNPVPTSGHGRTEATRASQVPGQPTVPLPCSPTPAGPNTPGHHDVSAWPPLCPQRRLPRKSCFRGSIARLQDSLFTLRPVRCHTRRKTRFRPLASVTGRAWLPAGLLRKVSDITHPPLPSFPGARTFTIS